MTSMENGIIPFHQTQANAKYKLKCYINLMTTPKLIIPMKIILPCFTILPVLTIDMNRLSRSCLVNTRSEDLQFPHIFNMNILFFTFRKGVQIFNNCPSKKLQL